MASTALNSSGRRNVLFGILAIAGFCLRMAMAILGLYLLVCNIGPWANRMGMTAGQADDWWTRSFGGAAYAGISAVIMWVLGIAFACISLVKAEKPRWPAITGLILCILPCAWLIFMLAK